jgi:predicted RNA-binding Zn-ribbon protein involved in translation (DUF1610 family)
MNGQLAETVMRVGFRKWYERQLLSSHAHMALAFLSVIALLASMEAFRGAQGDAQVMNMLFVIVCGAVAWWALRRYVFLMMRAERTANQASCPDCGEYGRFRIVRQRSSGEEVDVHCKKCSCEWMISGFE